MALRYPVKLTKDGDTLMVTAPDFPEVATYGDDEASALLHGADAVATAIQARITDREEIPQPSGLKRGQRLVVLSALTAAKLELYRTMQATKTTKAELGRRLKVKGPMIDRLLDLDHGSGFDQIENALRAMGKELHVSVQAAA